MSAKKISLVSFADGFLPANVLESGNKENLYRARVTLIVPFAVGASHLYSCFKIYQSADQLGGFRWVFWLAVLSSTLLFFSVAFFRRTGFFGVSANLYGLGAVLAIASVILVTGGFEVSPFTVLLPLVALFAFIMASIWTAFLWASLGLLLWWYGVTLEGIQYPNLISESWMDTVRIVTVLNAGVTLMGILWFFDFFHRHLRGQLREERDKALFSAAHDSLTGLANRKTFEAGLDNLIQHQRITETLSALVMMDLNDFKLINDLHGHASGDTLLKAVADNLKASVRQGDLPARLGGDEFGILLGDLRSIDDLPPLLEKIINNVTRPVFTSHGEAVVVGASLGVALIPDDGQDPEDLLHNADRAMYRAKNTETGYAFFRDLKSSRGTVSESGKLST